MYIWDVLIFHGTPTGVHADFTSGPPDFEGQVIEYKPRVLLCHLKSDPYTGGFYREEEERVPSLLEWQARQQVFFSRDSKSAKQKTTSK